MQPTIGRIVHYRLNEADADAINRRRRDFSAYCREHPTPAQPGQPGATGHQGHVGNPAAAGQVYPAMVVASWGGPTSVNLQVSLDGTDTYWATSRVLGDEPGQWSWPPRVGA